MSNLEIFIHFIHIYGLIIRCSTIYIRLECLLGFHSSMYIYGSVNSLIYIYIYIYICCCGDTIPDQLPFAIVVVDSIDSLF